MARKGRPLKEINQQQFENLCGLRCTEEEIAAWFKCSVDTIERWCTRTFKTTFAEVYRTYSANGKISLRRSQFQLAQRSSAMAIFLGREILGQGKQEISDIEGRLDSIFRLMEGAFKED